MHDSRLSLAQVYYCPVMSLHQQASLPNLFCFFPLLRSILLRERIGLVHGHQSTSALAHESLLHARTMGLPSVFTDHSLFSFSSPASIHLNKVMKFSLTSATSVICVSHCSKENLCLRAYVEPSKVAVIPNAVDTTKLTPNPNAAPPIHERQLRSGDRSIESMLRAGANRADF
jgi:phosphatidylinositol glycan class A protein